MYHFVFVSLLHVDAFLPHCHFKPASPLANQPVSSSGTQELCKETEKCYRAQHLLCSASCRVCVYVCVYLTLPHKDSEHEERSVCARVYLSWGREPGPPHTMPRLAPTVATSPWIRAFFFPPSTKSTLWLCLPGAPFQNFGEQRKEGGSKTESCERRGGEEERVTLLHACKTI